MKGAVADYTKALQLNPKLAAAYYKSGSATASRVAGMAPMPTPTLQGPLNFVQNTQRQAIKAGAKGTKTIRMLKQPNTLKPLSSARGRQMVRDIMAKSRMPKIIRVESMPSVRTQ